MLAWYSIVEGGVALAAVFANCTNPLPCLLAVARSSSYLTDFLPFSRFLSRRSYSPITLRFRDTPFPRPFYPHQTKEWKSKKERECVREKEKEKEEERMKRTERDGAYQAFGILTLLFYSLYTLNVRLNAKETFWSLLWNGWERGTWR